MTEEEMREFIGNVCRDEMNWNFAVYSKAIRATLIALGYNEDFVEETVFETREELEEELLKYIVYYNEYRPHQGIDGMKPAELCSKRLGNNE